MIMCDRGLSSIAKSLIVILKYFNRPVAKNDRLVDLINTLMMNTAKLIQEMLRMPATILTDLL